MTEVRYVRADSPFLTTILDALKKRSKALKHRNASPSIQRIVEVRENTSLERIEISIHPRGRQSLTVTVWDDRSIRVHACESVKNAGWLFQVTDSGRFSGSSHEREIVSAIEESISAMFEMSAETVGTLAPIWRPLLAKGPVELPNR